MVAWSNKQRVPLSLRECSILMLSLTLNCLIKITLQYINPALQKFMLLYRITENWKLVLEIIELQKLKNTERQPTKGSTLKLLNYKS